MSKPNFSGTWKLNRNESVLQIAPPDSTLFVIDHREPLFRISRTHIVGDKSDTFTLDLATDSTEVTLDRDGLRLRARAYWDDTTLVFDAKVARGDEEGTNVVRYRLSGSFESLIAEERFRSRVLSYDNKWVLDKVSPGG